MDKGDEQTVTAEEVSRSGYIQSKAMKYVTEWKVVVGNRAKLGSYPFTIHSAGVIQAA